MSHCPPQSPRICSNPCPSVMLSNHLILCQRRQWQPTPVFFPGKSYGQRRLVGCSPWGHKESDMTERLHFHFSLSCIGEGNGNPLQCSCLENPRDGGALWAAVYGVAQSRTQLKQLSSRSSILCHPLHLLLSVFPSIRVFSNESAFHIRWPKFWSFSFSNSSSKEYLGLISFRIDLFNLLAVHGTLKESFPAPEFKSINSLAPSLLYDPTLISIHDY